MRCQQSGPIKTIVALSSNEGGITTEQKKMQFLPLRTQTNNPVVAAQCRAQHEKNSKERDALRTTTTKQKLLLPYEQRDKYNNKKEMRCQPWRSHEQFGRWHPKTDTKWQKQQQKRDEFHYDHINNPAVKNNNKTWSWGGWQHWLQPSTLSRTWSFAFMRSGLYTTFAYKNDRVLLQERLDVVGGIRKVKIRNFLLLCVVSTFQKSVTESERKEIFVTS